MKKVLALVLCLSVSSMVSADLVHHWALDGNATDSGTVPVDGIASPTVTYAPGMFGQAAVFNGVDTLIDLPAQLLPSGTTITLAYWVNLDTYNAGSGFDTIIATDGWDVNSIHSVMRSTGEIAVGIGSGDGAATQWQTDAPIALSDWTHFAWTYELVAGTIECKYYIDGELDSTKTVTAAVAGITYDSAYIGAWDAWGTSARFLDGMVDDVRIYDEVLDVNAIGALVPEPMTMSLLALGGLALARRRR